MAGAAPATQRPASISPDIGAHLGNARQMTARAQAKFGERRAQFGRSRAWQRHRPVRRRIAEACPAAQNSWRRAAWRGSNAMTFAIVCSLSGFDSEFPPKPHQGSVPRNRKSRRPCLTHRIEGRQCRHRLIVEIEAVRFDQISELYRGRRCRANVASSAAATGFAAASPARSPSSTSRHHCSRISPGIGSRARSRTRDDLDVEGIEREQRAALVGRREQRREIAVAVGFAHQRRAILKVLVHVGRV